ncbi:MBOAT family O-acyltransferase [Flavobacterium sp. RSSB_23]|uniref:MBOAT family O-acyltransferase n=1 Tax=Flavobacterium sp. RSSB_23 TaxID=3447668 RepID=UPI003F3EC117
MLFNSFDFLIFFVLVFIVFFALAPKWRGTFLLIASCFFYMRLVPIYILILFLTILIDYFAGILIENQTKLRNKKIILIVSLMANILLLGYFKYVNFFIENWNFIAFNFFSQDLKLDFINIILPIGLSFHTFQSMAYTIEVYRGTEKAERNLGIYSLYVMFFPQLVAGPIERPSALIPQLRKNDQKINFDYFVCGLTQFSYGLFKKAIVADSIAVYVNTVYPNYELNSGSTLLVATYLFAFQIYCDFSGYSDMAIGIAKMMGYDLMENFNAPYFSKSVTEFWRRWHISLSFWLRDYLYFSLGGNRKGTLFTYRNLIITMLIGGLWHGASWNYIIWGALIAVFLCVEKYIDYPKLIKDFATKNIFAKVFFSFLVFNLICITWIFFRAETLHQAIIILKKCFTDLSISDFYINSTVAFGTAIAGIFITIGFDYLYLRKGSFKQQYNPKSLFFYASFVILILLLVILFSPQSGDQFIYFQF